MITPAPSCGFWPWQSWQYGVQGILIWETDYWTSPAAFPPPKLQDPWTDPMSYKSGYGEKPGEIGYWGNGDGRFLYPPRREPGENHAPCLDAPVNSLRWENLRDGMEDYEYFWLLQQGTQTELALRGDTELYRQARELLKVPTEVSQDLTHFTTDPRLMLAYRDRVARMIERLQRTPRTLALCGRMQQRVRFEWGIMHPNGVIQNTNKYRHFCALLSPIRLKSESKMGSSLRISEDTQNISLVRENAATGEV